MTWLLLDIFRPFEDGIADAIAIFKRVKNNSMYTCIQKLYHFKNVFGTQLRSVGLHFINNSQKCFGKNR